MGIGLSAWVIGPVPVQRQRWPDSVRGVNMRTCDTGVVFLHYEPQREG